MDPTNLYIKGLPSNADEPLGIKVMKSRFPNSGGLPFSLVLLEVRVQPP